MPKKKVKTDVVDKEWSCLSSLRDYFERTGDEKVVDFEGHTLITKKHKYTLFDGQLTRDPR